MESELEDHNPWRHHFAWWIPTLSDSTWHSPSSTACPHARNWNCFRYDFGDFRAQRNPGTATDHGDRVDYDGRDFAWDIRIMKEDDLMKQNAYDDDTFFEGYKNLRESGSGLNDVLEQPSIRSLLPGLSGLDVLDLGCGMGQFAAYCTDSGANRVVCVDISEKMIEYARAHYTGENIEYIQMAIEDVQFPESSFDLVVSSFVMHYVADYGALVQNVFRWLRPGGKFVYSCEHPIVTAKLPGCGHWVKDEEGRKLHWCIDNYGDEGIRRQTWFIEGVIKYHRKLSTLINEIIRQGFVIERVLEPDATQEAIESRPNLVEERRRPPILVIGAMKP
jgi:2-polyprenyl-3-methyl-5-hydroxy-6-metoxy-1,4-benzoquinol methylase